MCSEKIAIFYAMLPQSILEQQEENWCKSTGRLGMDFGCIRRFCSSFPLVASARTAAERISHRDRFWGITSKLVPSLN
jgi:hypothetical protein